MSLIKSRTAKYVAGLALALALVVIPMTTHAATIAELQAMIQSLSAQLSALQGGTTPTTTVGAYTFNTNLTVGSKGADVLNLQKLLNSASDTQVASTGAGSPGNETSTFGPATKAAVIKLQKKYGITPAAGYVGAITRAKLNTLGGTTASNPGTTTPGTNPTGGSLTVAAASQPANSLVPSNAVRVPFTTFSITAGSSDVTVNSVTVERVGLSHSAAFAGVVLLKGDGTQLGVAKTLNSNDQANVGEPTVIKAGTTMTFTVAGNMGSLSSYSGEIAGLNVVAINTTASVTGSLPITGAQITFNGSLSIGSATTRVSSYDPASSQSKEIGTTGYKFAGVQVTAGSAEDIRLMAVRFNQSGSASMNDLANVKIVVDGTSYDTTVSADGKYYSAVFGNGIVITKGLSKDIYIQGDIVGTGAAGRTVKFDIYKSTDLYLKGETYGYGITPTPGSTTTASDSTSEFTGGTPWFDGSKVTVSAGSVTSISKATNVAAANIAVNVPNQVLGGFIADIKGEPISVQTLKFTIATSGTWTSTSPITDITLVDQNGAVVAGPEDMATTGTGAALTFSDTVTFPVGVHTYTLKGKIPTGAPDGATVIVTAKPSTWEGITGQTTGNTISFTGVGDFPMNTQTVKGASLVITNSPSPAVQNIVSGGTTTFANIALDASQSGEDVKFGAIPLVLDNGTRTFAGAPNKLTSCQLFDGTTALTTGSNVVSPTETATSTAITKTFTLDSQYTVPKGTVKTLTLKCNVSSTAHNNSTFQWGVVTGSAMTVTGVTSGSDVGETIVTGTGGQIQTVATGSFTGAIDPSSPNYSVVAGGASGVTMGVYKFRASNEDVNLTKVGLSLVSGNIGDIGTVYLYNGNTLVGTAFFTQTGTVATSTLIAPVKLPANTDVLLTIKADLAGIGSGQTGVEGQAIKIGVTNAEGNGVSSGNTLPVGSISTAVAGVRMFRSFPVVAQDTLPSTGVADGKLMKFKVTADSHGPVGLYNLNFKISTSSFAADGGVTNVKVMVYSDSAYSQQVSGTFGAASGQFGSTVVSSITAPTLNFTTTGGSASPLEIPAGTTYYFQVESTVMGTQTGSSVTTTLNGDSAFWGINTASNVASTTSGTGNFAWSANGLTSTSVSAAGDNDWSNGFGILGLPSGGFSQTRSI